MFSSKKTVQKTSWFSWTYRILAIFIFIGAIWLFKNGFGGPLLWPRTLAIGLLADVVTMSALILSIWARITLGRNWSGNVVLKENHELIMSGPYAYVRHPIYSSLILFVLGIVIYYGRLGGIIFLVLFIAGAWFKAYKEEKLLTSHFGEKYLAYKKMVKGLIPWIL